VIVVIGVILIAVIVVIGVILIAVIVVIGVILVAVIVVIGVILVAVIGVILIACHYVCFDEAGHRYDSCIGLVCRIQGGQQSLFKE
ncbi:MAG: hypothetical protein VXW34_10150, partial [Actinomycetota bacterium]|nr:hypothetical protein [Actinomycetota bacterium]